MKQDVRYIDQINAFERWLETSYLSTGSQLLWYKLIVLFNRSRWNEWVTVDNRRLMSLMQVNREATFVEWRNSLIEAGLLQYKKGKKGSPNQYKMNFFTFNNEVQPVVNNDCTFKSEVNRVVNTVVNGVVQSEVYPVVQTVDIIRQRQDKDKDKSITVKKEKRKNAIFDLVAAYAPEGELRAALLAFAEMRKKQGTFTEHACSLLLKKLDSLSESYGDRRDEAKILLVNRSVENGWKGLFPLKEPLPDMPVVVGSLPESEPLTAEEAASRSLEDLLGW